MHLLTKTKDRNNVATAKQKERKNNKKRTFTKSCSNSITTPVIFFSPAENERAKFICSQVLLPFLLLFSIIRFFFSFAWSSWLKKAKQFIFGVLKGDRILGQLNQMKGTRYNKTRSSSVCVQRDFPASLFFLPRVLVIFTKKHMKPERSGEAGLIEISHWLLFWFENGGNWILEKWGRDNRENIFDWESRPVSQGIWWSVSALVKTFFPDEPISRGYRTWFFFLSFFLWYFRHFSCSFRLSLMEPVSSLY